MSEQSNLQTDLFYGVLCNNNAIQRNAFISISKSLSKLYSLTIYFMIRMRCDHLSLSRCFFYFLQIPSLPFILLYHYHHHHIVGKQNEIDCCSYWWCVGWLEWKGFLPTLRFLRIRTIV
jgi:hypothetical protein